jgi:hypothetical protein
MKPFAVKGLGEAYLRLLNPPTFRRLMRHQGIADLSKITTAELDASSFCSAAPTTAAPS